MTRSPREALILALAAKFLALGLIYALFFAPAKRPAADAAAVAKALLAEPAS
jgi:type II secretory pathway component PulM